MQVGPAVRRRVQPAGGSRRVGQGDEPAVGGLPPQLVPGADQVGPGAGDQRRYRRQGAGQVEVVVVTKAQVAAPGFGQGAVAGGADAAVFLGEHPHPGVGGGQRTGQLQAAVGGTVVHQQQFQVALALVQHAAGGRFQRGGGVVHRHQDAEQRRLGCRLILHRSHPFCLCLSAAYTLSQGSGRGSARRRKAVFQRASRRSRPKARGSRR